MSEQSVKAWLESQQEQFAEAAKQAAEAPEKGEFKNPPDGKYVLQLEEVEVGFSQNSGRPQVKWVWEIKDCADTDWIGKKKFDYDGLDKENSFYYLCLKLKKFGLNVEGINPSNLEENLQLLQNSAPTVEARLKTKKDFQNTFIDKMVDEGYDPFADGSSPREPGTVTLKPGMTVEYKDEDTETILKAAVVEVKSEEGIVVVKRDRKTFNIFPTQIVGVS